MKDYGSSIGNDFDDLLEYDSESPSVSPLTEEIERLMSPTGSESRIYDEQSTFLDRDLYRSSFLIGEDNIEDEDAVASMNWTSASFKFTDTSMGGNYGINSRPQFTQYSDVPVKGMIKQRADPSINDSSGDYGMGRYYSEAIDDPSHTIYMRFGTPEYNGLFSFILDAIAPSDVALVRASRFSSAFAQSYLVSKIVASPFVFAKFPAFFVLNYAATLAGGIFSRGVKRYYNLRPAMALYWSAVNNLINHVAVNLNMLPKTLQERGANYAISVDETNLKDILDTIYGLETTKIFGEDNLYFNMYAIANRAQMLHNRAQEAEILQLEENGTLEKYYVKDQNGYVSPTIDTSQKQGGLRKQLDAWFSSKLGLGVFNSESNTPTGGVRNYVLQEAGEVYNPATELDHNALKDVYLQDVADPIDVERPSEDSGVVMHTRPKKDKNGLLDMIESLRKDGADFAVFKTDFPGQADESFSNSTTELPIKSTFNGASKNMNRIRSSLGQFNTGIDIVDGVIESVSGMLAGSVAGAASAATFGFSDIVVNSLRALFGDAYMDIPKIWDDATARLTTANYKMTLISPYNNPISLMQNIYMPLCMLLAGAIPRSTGKSSYHSPFICQLFDRGRNTIMLGLISELSISRGTSNLSFDPLGKALAVDVNFSVVNLSSVMHYAMTNGSIFDSTASLNEDSPMGEYLATISGMSIGSMIYPVPRALLRLQRFGARSKQLFSQDMWLTHFADGFVGDVFKMFTPAEVSFLEGSARQSSQ